MEKDKVIDTILGFITWVNKYKIYENERGAALVTVSDSGFERFLMHDEVINLVEEFADEYTRKS